MMDHKPLTLTKSLVLIGMPAAGKSTIGKKIARKLDIAFCDSDHEIVAQSNRTIPEIFAAHGEPFFRDVERKTIARIIEGPPCVLSTGGGAFINDETRALVKKEALSVWLKADYDVLLARIMRNVASRPLFTKGDPATILRDLMDKREPYYAQADLVVEIEERKIYENVRSLFDTLRRGAFVK
ncbi:MAG: shikimate kinase [Proteobacteria bacterium]|jgi:shikimate kinase|nr:shikimate kinase [Alphaproteobacteria bacterium]NCC04079.1 shikimate kinase [Pseudomonadota bacterium]